MAGYAITTRYVGPTNYRGSRIIATGPSVTHDGPKVRATVSYEAALNAEGAHRLAAAAVVERLRAAGWNVTLAPDYLALPGEDGYVFGMVYA